MLPFSGVIPTGSELEPVLQVGETRSQRRHLSTTTTATMKGYTMIPWVIRSIGTKLQWSLGLRGGIGDRCFVFSSCKIPLFNDESQVFCVSSVVLCWFVLFVL